MFSINYICPNFFSHIYHHIGIASIFQTTVGATFFQHVARIVLFSDHHLLRSVGTSLSRSFHSLSHV